MSVITITTKGHRCDDCGYMWVPPLGQHPAICPRCGTEDWEEITGFTNEEWIELQKELSEQS